MFVFSFRFNIPMLYWTALCFSQSLVHYARQSPGLLVAAFSGASFAWACWAYWQLFCCVAQPSVRLLLYVLKDTSCDLEWMRENQIFVFPQNYLFFFIEGLWSYPSVFMIMAPVVKILDWHIGFYLPTSKTSVGGSINRRWRLPVLLYELQERFCFCTC